MGKDEDLRRKVPNQLVRRFTRDLDRFPNNLVSLAGLFNQLAVSSSTDHKAS